MADSDTPSSPPPPLSSKAFPPPALADVPVEYIIDQLHNLAPEYWDKPETADCTIVVPVPHPIGNAPIEVPHNVDPSGMGRRVTEPGLSFVPRISFKLHTDYLCAHSGYLRALFGGASPIDLISSSGSSLHTSSGKFVIPADRLPRLLPSSADHPVLYLPVPDPSSFQLLVHWIYFGETHYIEDCLNKGIIQWEGIARNVEYLGLPTDIKIFLGRWYGTWLHPAEQAEEDAAASDSDSYESDSASSDDDSMRFEEDDSTSFATEVDMEVDELQLDKDYEEREDVQRGRTRTTKCLSWPLAEPSFTSLDGHVHVPNQNDHRSSLQIQITL